MEYASLILSLKITCNDRNTDSKTVTSNQNSYLNVELFKGTYSSHRMTSEKLVLHFRH